MAVFLIDFLQVHIYDLYARKKGLKMNFDTSYKTCSESIRARIKFEWETFTKLETDNERLVYLFITQPKVRYVSILSIATVLNMSPKDVLNALWGILMKKV